jgi:beta-lactamase regulating signal transducer with metallopeptidase domain
VIAGLVETLVTVTLLMLLVLALRGPVARLFGAGWAYALWAVPALRLVLPPLPLISSDISLPAVVATIPAAAAGGAAPLPAEAGAGQWLPLILAVWAGGAVIFLTLQWLAYRSLLHKLHQDGRPGRPPSHGGIPTLVSRFAEGPLALGLIDRRIVLPADFHRRYTPSERRLALDHELTHHRRLDIWWNVAAAVVLAVNWFNPVAWIAFRAFRADQELACDAAVAARASSDERWDYARALLKAASHGGPMPAAALTGAGELKRRIRMMRGHKISFARRAGGLGAFAGFALVAFAVGAPAVTQAAKDAPRQIASAAHAALPTAVVPAPAAAPAVVRVSAKPRAVRRAVKPAAEAAAVNPFAAELAIVPDEAIAPPAPDGRRQVRVMRIVTQEKHALGTAGRSELVVLADASAALPHAEALARVLSRGVAGEMRIGIARPRTALRRFSIRMTAFDEGEGSQWTQE